MENLFKELSSTRTQELKGLLNSIQDALSKLKEEDHLNYLLFTRVSGQIEEIILKREVDILLSSLTVQTLSERVDSVRGFKIVC
jgi:hypothetical protein